MIFSRVSGATEAPGVNARETADRDTPASSATSRALTKRGTAWGLSFAVMDEAYCPTLASTSARRNFSTTSMKAIDGTSSKSAVIEAI